MQDFKLCENGHYFPKSLNECPYCPKSESQFKISDQDKTFLDLDSNQQTQIFGNLGNNLNRTKIYSEESFDPFLPSTFQPQFQPKQTSYGRKLVGWLVSFTMDPNGADFKLFEGRNLIGSDMGCDIVVNNDQAVSGRHLTILHRMGHFKFKDELSTNGTFINDIFVEEGNLKDGDIIRMGDTIFKFRSIA